MKSFYEMAKIIEANATAPAQNPVAPLAASNPTPAAAPKPAATDQAKSQANQVAGAQAQLAAIADKQKQTTGAELVKKLKMILNSALTKLGVKGVSI